MSAAVAAQAALVSLNIWLLVALKSVGSPVQSNPELRAVPISVLLLHPQVPKGVSYGTGKGSDSWPLSTQQRL